MTDLARNLLARALYTSRRLALDIGHTNMSPLEPQYTVLQITEHEARAEALLDQIREAKQQAVREARNGMGVV